MRDLWLDRLLAPRLVPVEPLPATLVRRLLDPGDRVGLAVDAVVRERRESRGHVQGRDLLDAERDGRHGIERRADAHRVGGLDDVLGAHVDGELREDDVGRVLGRVPQVHVAAARGALGVLHAS